MRLFIIYSNKILINSLNNDFISHFSNKRYIQHFSIFIRIISFIQLINYLILSAHINTNYKNNKIEGHSVINFSKCFTIRGERRQVVHVKLARVQSIFHKIHKNGPYCRLVEFRSWNVKEHMFVVRDSWHVKQAVDEQLVRQQLNDGQLGLGRLALRCEHRLVFGVQQEHERI